MAAVASLLLELEFISVKRKKKDTENMLSLFSPLTGSSGGSALHLLI